MSLTIWEHHLADPRTELQVLHADGAVRVLPTHRWIGPPTPVDEQMLAHAVGPVLDIGCGPGRLAAALRRRGVESLGIDISPAAVSLARRAGADAEIRSVFDPRMRVGQWRSVLLADGNIGIGGDPRRLLRRVGELLSPGGVAVVELEGDGSYDGSAERIRLRCARGPAGGHFDWARLSATGIASLLGELDLELGDSWSATEINGDRRSFANLVRR